MPNLICVECLKDENGNWTDKSMTTAVGTYYSSPIRTHFCDGDTALLVLTSAGSLAITFEVSNNGINWYTPYDTDGQDLSVVYGALTGDKWIVFTPEIAEYIRFKFVLTSSNSTVTARYIHKEWV
jgi:hypothetical protein